MNVKQAWITNRKLFLSGAALFVCAIASVSCTASAADTANTVQGEEPMPATTTVQSSTVDTNAAQQLVSNIGSLADQRKWQELPELFSH